MAVLFAHDLHVIDDTVKAPVEIFAEPTGIDLATVPRDIENGLMKVGTAFAAVLANPDLARRLAFLSVERSDELRETKTQWPIVSPKHGASLAFRPTFEAGETQPKAFDSSWFGVRRPGLGVGLTSRNTLYLRFDRIAEDLKNE